MDVIDRAIEKGKHLLHYEGGHVQTWEIFREEAAEKKVILFGLGEAASLFWKRCDAAENLVAICDNNPEKQGISASEFLFLGAENKYQLPLVSGKEALAEHKPEETVVLIASINYYTEIVNEVKEFGHNNCFILLMMEANGRGTNPEICKSMPSHAEQAQLFCKERIDFNKILFHGFGTYSGHGKYITQSILGQNRQVDIVWMTKNALVQVPNGVRKVCLENYCKYLYEIETAGIVLMDTIIPREVIKRSEQIYIHLKHWASVTLKKFYLDSRTLTDVQEDVIFWRSVLHKLDYVFVGSWFDEESVRRGFEFKGETVNVGSPRSDALFCGSELRRSVYQYFDIDDTKHMLLYAPTYRYNQDMKRKHIPETRNINIDYEQVHDALVKKFKGKWVILLRLHPGHERDAMRMNLPEYVINATDYEDGEELCVACDCLISDYSSIMFEPAFVKKPVFLFATDRDEYIDKEYDLLMDYDSLPFSIAESNEELVWNIARFDQKMYENKVDAFLKKYGVHEDGHASERAADFILKLLERMYHA